MAGLLKRLLAGVAFFLLASCGGGGGGGGGYSGTPYISAEIDSFTGPGTPRGQSAHVRVLRDDGAQITDATVTINGTPISYDQTQKEYRGTTTVAPGASVNLAVTLGANTYTVSGNQANSYPSVSFPVSGTTWQKYNVNTVAWTIGTTTDNTMLKLAMIDAGTGAMVWPQTGHAQTVDRWATSFTIPAGNMPAGDRYLLVGSAVPYPIASAAAGSTLVVAGFTSIPVTVADDPDFHWTATSPLTPSLYGVTWSGSQFVAVGVETINYLPGGGWNGAYTIFTSPDGSRWTSRNFESPSATDLYGIASSGSRLVAVGMGRILSSDDGISWNKRLDTHAILRGVVWSGSQFVAAGQGDGAGVGSIQTSPDGTTWVAQSLPFDVSLNSIVWSGSGFVAVGFNGAIVTSPDGTTWTARTSTTRNELHGIAWSGSQYVAVGAGGVILTSPDGITWTARDSGTTGTLFSVCWSGRNFVATGWYGGIFVSADGIHWTQATPLTSNQLYGIASAGNRLVAVGYSSTILTSP